MALTVWSCASSRANWISGSWQSFNQVRSLLLAGALRVSAFESLALTPAHVSIRQMRRTGNEMSILHCAWRKSPPDSARQRFGYFLTAFKMVVATRRPQDGLSNL